MRPSKTILATLSILLFTKVISADNELKVNTRILQEVSTNSMQLKSLDEAIPNSVVAYEHTLSNPTITVATDLVFTDIVPQHTTFVAGSANCQDCEILYSIDGEIFEKAFELFTYDSGSLRVARPNEYRHIRWIIKKINPNSKQKIIFKTKID
jgi:uncharacterized repeat protein (TIGR01451 family)